MQSVLIIEDDITFVIMLKTWLKKHGFETDSASSVADAKRVFAEKQYDLVLSDLRLPDSDGIDFLEWAGKIRPETPVIMMTSYAEVQSAVKAIKTGAYDYVSKPVNPEELLKKMQEAIEKSTATGKLTSYPTPEEAAERSIGSNSVTNNTPIRPDNEEAGSSISGTTKNTGFIHGESDSAKRLYEYVSLVAPTGMSVLINGSSGTGKEHIARLIHEQSSRKGNPFVAIDCGAIPHELAASEFFGHIKGSFTGAVSDKTGAFAAANGGTLFLDEIGNLSYETQVQLLRALQERRIRPIGSNKEIAVDVRVVSATNENLEKAIAKGSFREDLYHRINEFSLRVPDLRERKEDIILFANHFLDTSNRELDKRITGFSREAEELILDYGWPGNLRQMKNVIKRATLLAPGAFITPELFPAEILTPTDKREEETSLRKEDKERILIMEALRKADNNKSKAAQLLGIDRKTLYNKLKLYNIEY